jgi:hypothetical protein
MNAEDRVRTAAEATAASVRQIRPLTLPDDSAVWAELREHPGRDAPRVSGPLRNIKETWLIPLAAAAAVAALAVSLVIFRHAVAPRPAPSQASAGTGIPRYYAIATQGPANHDAQAAIDVTVGDVHTGKAVATVALPAVGVTPGVNGVAGVSAAGDDRTWVVGRRDEYGTLDYFQVHIAPGTKQVALVEHLPISQVQLGVPLGFAVSPNDKELAVLSVRGNGTTLRTYSVKSGATLRTWTAGTWHYQGLGASTGVSWTADNLQVAFSTVVTTGQSAQGPLEERLVSATAPSGDLATASKVVLQAPSNCSSLLLTPDGGAVVCATQVNYPPTRPLASNCGTSGPMFVAYSTAATGAATTAERLRVLYQYTGPCEWGMNTVLWADDSARHVIGESVTQFQGNPPQSTDRYGVVAAGKFTEIRVAPHGQWYGGPAF